MNESVAAHALTATEMVNAIGAGKLKPLDIIESLAQALPGLDAQVQAWAHLDLDSARAAAKAAGTPAGILAGVPFAAKDNIDTHDMPTGFGSAIYTGRRASRDASCVAGMRLAGAVLVGKTVATEFAHRFPGKTRNPFNSAHTPGGSSSGSAAAVGAKMVPIAFGTQTTGSVIRPAAYCGTVGYKPTFGDFNVTGVLPNTPGFDTIGTMTRCVEDIVLVRRALLDSTIPALRPRPIEGMRVGVCRTPFWDSKAEPEARAAIEDSAKVLASAGARVRDFDGGGAFDGLEEANLMVSGYEFARTLAFERAHHYDQLSPILRDGRMADGLRATYGEYVLGARTLERLRLVLEAALADFDVLITPPAPGPAPAGIGSTGAATFNMPWTTLHTPVITLPTHVSGSGLPVGVQLVAKRYEDAQLLDCAATVFEVVGIGREV